MMQSIIRESATTRRVRGKTCAYMVWAQHGRALHRDAAASARSPSRTIPETGAVPMVSVAPPRDGRALER